MVVDRRKFLSKAGSCAAWIFGLSAAYPMPTRAAFSQTDSRKVVAKELWARLEELSDGIWAVVSTPFESRDFTTVSNGGIIAGKDRVLVIESFNEAKGASWLAEQAKKLTGKWPTDVVVTHFHADHSAGSEGYRSPGQATKLWLTEKTRSLIESQNRQRNRSSSMLEDIENLDSTKPVTLDLGGRTVTLTSHVGHTPSDVVIEVNEPSVVFCGDLFFNRLVPNYSDARPIVLKKTVAGLARQPDTLYVPGHGSIAGAADLATYQEFLQTIEDAVRTAHQRGAEIPAAAAAYQLPERFAEWYIFSPQVIPRAFSAWYRELDSAAHKQPSRK